MPKPQTVEFIEAYDHVWPSRATTHFPVGFIGLVKGEVAERAIKAGKAQPTKLPEPEAQEPVDSETKSG